MKFKTLFVVILSAIFFFSVIQSLVSYPVWNDIDVNNKIAGCDNACHERNPHKYFPDMVEATVLSNNQISVRILGVDPKSVIGGELVDMDGNVIMHNNHTPNNPFILTAPGPGRYLVNAGGWDKVKKLYWDSVYVEIKETTTSSIEILNFGVDRICVGTRFDLQYDLEGDFEDDNVFNVRLSNVNGGFGSETEIIGLVHSSESGYVPCQIPEHVKAGNKYKIRVESSLPKIISNNVVPVVIAGKPYAQIGILNGDHSFCKGDIIELKALSDNPHLDFEWSTGEDTQEISVTEPGIYILKVTNLAGCFAKDTIELTQFDKPTPSISGINEISEREVYKYSVEYNQGNQYDWEVLKGEIIEYNDNRNEILVAWNELGDGVVCVTETNSDGCDSTDCQIVNVVVGVEENNPSNDGLSVKLLSNSNILEIRNMNYEANVSCEVFDLQGRTVKRFTINNSIERFDLSDLLSGAYFLVISSSNQEYQSSFMLE